MRWFCDGLREGERSLNLGVSVTFKDGHNILASYLRCLGIFQHTAFTGNFKP